MLNKKGQTLVMFVILLPILIGMFAFVVDCGIIAYEKSKLNNLISLSMKQEKDIDRLLKDNGIKEYNKITNDGCYIVNYKKESLFGSIVGIKEYNIKSSSCERGKK